MKDKHSEIFCNLNAFNGTSGSEVSLQLGAHSLTIWSVWRSKFAQITNKDWTKLTDDEECKLAERLSKLQASLL